MLKSIKQQILSQIHPPSLVKLEGEFYLVPAYVKIPPDKDPKEFFLKMYELYWTSNKLSLTLNIWEVKSESSNQVYHVQFIETGYICDCPGFKFHGHCKHIEKISNLFKSAALD